MSANLCGRVNHWEDQRGKEDVLDAPTGMSAQQKNLHPDKSENEGIQES
jgi:hypothetical protein